MVHALIEDDNHLSPPPGGAGKKSKPGNYDGPYFKPTNNIAKDRGILKKAEKTLKQLEYQNAAKLNLGLAPDEKPVSLRSASGSGSQKRKLKPAYEILNTYHLHNYNDTYQNNSFHHTFQEARMHFKAELFKNFQQLTYMQLSGMI
jgi:hypothetical protein